jgi:hypothetical protein
MSEEQKKKPRKVMPFEMTIELREPIKLTGSEETTYTEINLREPNVSQISQFLKKNQKENAVDTVKYLISIISGVPIPVIERIGATDFYKAQQYLLFFLNPPDEDDAEGNVAASQ